MRKYKAGGGLLSVFACVGSAEVMLAGRVSHRNHTGLHTHTHTQTHTAHTDKETEKTRLYFDAGTKASAAGPPRFYLQKIN